MVETSMLPRRCFKMLMKFQRHGTVLNRWKGNSGRRRRVCFEENIRRVEELIQDGRTTSLRRLARILGDICVVTVRAILRFDIKAKPYHLELLHKLTPQDLPRRIKCCRQILNFVDEQDLDFLFFSDEARFFC